MNAGHDVAEESQAENQMAIAGALETELENGLIHEDVNGFVKGLSIASPKKQRFH